MRKKSLSHVFSIPKRPVQPLTLRSQFNILISVGYGPHIQVLYVKLNFVKNIIIMRSGGW